MIDFEEELRKFHPSQEIEGIEDTIFAQNGTDIADALIQILDKKAKETEDL